MNCNVRQEMKKPNPVGVGSADYMHLAIGLNRAKVRNCCNTHTRTHVRTHTHTQHARTDRQTDRQTHTHYEVLSHCYTTHHRSSHSQYYRHGCTVSEMTWISIFRTPEQRQLSVILVDASTPVFHAFYDTIEELA